MSLDQRRSVEVRGHARLGWMSSNRLVRGPGPLELVTLMVSFFEKTQGSSKDVGLGLVAGKV
jgi:hypothetical protein